MIAVIEISDLYSCKELVNWGLRGHSGWSRLGLQDLIQLCRNSVRILHICQDEKGVCHEMTYTFKWMDLTIYYGPCFSEGFLRGKCNILITLLSF